MAKSISLEAQVERRRAKVVASLGGVAPSKSGLSAASPAAQPRLLGRRKVADPSPEANASSTPTRSETQATGAQERSAMRIVALDLGSKISYCEVKGGRVVERATVKSLAELQAVIGPNTPPAKVAFEACREAWAVYDQLNAWGHEPLMLDTTRVRQLGIGQHKRKNDRIDAETMAMALELGRIPLAHVLSPHRRALRVQLGVRRALVEARAAYVTQIRGVARAHGKRLPKCDTDNFVERLRETPLDEAVRMLVAPLVKVLEVLTPQIALVEAKIEQLCKEEPVVKRLCTSPGVRIIVAAAFVSVIDDAKRFGRAHQVEAYLGLVPSENTSVHRRLGAITKQGNSYLRALLVQAAHSIFRLRADDPLKQWGQALEARRGKRIAVIAVARRLVGILWAMWRDGSEYRPTKLAVASATGLACHADKLDRQAEKQRTVVRSPGNRPNPRADARKTPRRATMP